MATTVFTHDRSNTRLLAVSCHTIAGIVAECAALAMDQSTSMPAAGRRFLSEAKRPDYSVRRARMFQWWDEFYEWMAYAPAVVATLPAERMRGMILRNLPPVSVDLVTKIHDENRIGDESNVLERCYLAEKTPVRIDGVIHGWSRQLEITRSGLDVAHAARQRAVISVPRHLP